MQLNKFTDYALRVLMYVAPERDLPYTIAEIAQNLHVSQNHLIKIVHFMAKQNWVITSRGKGGGIRLNPNVLTLQLGTLVQTLQGDAQIVDCQKPEPCILLPRCGLKGILNQALIDFYQSLNQYTFAQALALPAHHQSPLSIDIVNL
jgi:Rrf2 family transcriptional regulator, nitric oxide-sensitive transcriptional repressor